MIVKRTFVPLFAAPGPPRAQVEVFVAECEVCGFSAVSRYEHDAVAIIERHKIKCSKSQKDQSRGDHTSS
jgi:hypothetical protein